MFSVGSLSMSRSNLANCVLFLIAIVGTASAQRTESIYTSLAEEDCRNLPEQIGDGVVYAGECKGVGGFKIVHVASEHSSIIDLIDPAGRGIKLNIRSLMGTAAPSMLGDKVEWRVKKEKNGKAEPYALFARVNVFDDPNNASKQKSYLVVIRSLPNLRALPI